MASREEDIASIPWGLDRAELGERPRVESHHRCPQENSSDHCQVSIRHTLREILPTLIAHPHDGIRKVKGIAREKSAFDPTVEQKVPILAPEPPYATGNERLVHDLEPRRKFPPAKEFVRHPVAALKTVARDQGGDDFAANVMRSEVSHGESVRLLQQEEKIIEAHPEQHDAELQTLIDLKSARQDAFVRWSVDRHIRRVGVLRGVGQSPKRAERSYSWRGRISYAQRYLRYRLERAEEEHITVNPEEKTEPTQELLMSSIERVVVVSAAFQSFVMAFRSISHWENPRISALYMSLYFALLFWSQITRSAILLVLCQVLYRRWKPPGLTDLRSAVEHAEDQNQAIKTLTELTLQYGTRGWVDHVIDQAGPGLLQLSERVADLLKRVQNFYEWRDPALTRLLLYKLFGLWVLLTLTPTWLLVQMSFFMAGISFFILEPLGYHYPQYQLLASPMMWMLWAIPTHADWAIARLQAEAMPHVQPGSKDTPTSPGSKSPEHGPCMIGRYSCTGGIFKVTTQSAVHTSGDSGAAGWSFNFEDLTEMHKVQRHTRTREIKGLSFMAASGDRQTAWDLEQRDEIFSQILGYSRLRWKKIE